jgi:hypothetical protein
LLRKSIQQTFLQIQGLKEKKIIWGEWGD